MSDITRSKVESLMQDISAYVQQRSKEYGLALERVSGRYDAAGAKFTVSVVPINQSGVPVPKFVGSFAKLASRYGLKPSDQGRFFNYQGLAYKVAGIKSANKKYPIIGERDGKSYKFPASVVVNALRAAEEAEAARKEMLEALKSA